MLTQLTDNERRAFLLPVPGKVSDKAALFLQGFPKYPGPSMFTDFLQELGYDVFLPMYSGTFESEGSFSIESAVDDVMVWMRFIQNGKIYKNPGETENRSYKEIILFSSSFGGLVAALALKKFSLEAAKAAIFLSPLWDMASFEDNEKQRVTAMEVRQIMDFCYPISYRFLDKDAFFEQISGTRDLPEYNGELNIQTANHIFCGRDDSTTPIAMAQNLADSLSNSTLDLLAGGHSSRIDISEFKRHVRERLRA